VEHGGSIALLDAGAGAARGARVRLVFPVDGELEQAIAAAAMAHEKTREIV
jgi:nitrogen fixation/metabolism regulation signal transduction histidine kinase